MNIKILNDHIANLSNNFELSIEFSQTKYIGSDVFKFLEELKQTIKKSKIDVGKINLIFFNENHHINLAIIGWVVLFTKSKDFQNIEIIFDTGKLVAGHPMIFKLRQYAAYSYFFSDTKLKFKNRIVLNFNPVKILESLTFSLEYLPCFLISADNINIFNDLFNKSHITKHLSTVPLFSSRTATDITKVFFKSKDITVISYTVTLLRLALAKIPKRLLERLNVRIVDESYERRILQELEKCNAYTLLLFSFLLNHTDFNRLRSRESEWTYKYIIGLIVIAKAQAVGIQELTINILQHSTTKMGILIGRFSTGNDLVSMYSTETNRLNFMSEYSKISYNLLDNSFFDIHIIDDSTKGILDTNENETEDNLAGMFNLFRNSAKENTSKYLKTKAKLGLVTFKQSVIMLNGFFSVSSPFRRRIETYCQFGDYESPIDNSFYKSGTYYSILLPQPDNEKIENIQTANADKIDSNNFADLLNYHFFKFRSNNIEISLKSNQKLLCEFILPTITPNFQSKYNYELLVVNNAEKYFSALLKFYPDTSLIPVLDIRNSPCTSNTGYFFRIIAGLIACLPTTDFIILGISMLNFELIIDIIKKENPFWGKNTTLLFYIEHEDLSLTRGYHPILLTGETYNDFININRIYCNVELDKAVPIQSDIYINSQLIRLSSKKIIEFDILVETEGKTLFQKYCEYCLNKTII